MRGKIMLKKRNINAKNWMEQKKKIMLSYKFENTYGQNMDAFVGFANTNPSPLWAEKFFNRYVAYMCRRCPNKTKQELEMVARENVGYMVGYYKKEKRDKMYKTYPMIFHPIFGRAY